MADNRIHPGGSSREEDYYHPFSSPSPDKTTPLSSAPSSAPGIYTIQIRKDRTFGPAPPRRQAPRPQRARCRKCCAGCVCVIGFALIALVALVVALFFLCSKPPKYSIDALSIRGLNLTSSTTAVYSPTMNVTLRATNPHNNVIGINYRKESSVAVSHSDVQLCRGVFPAFYQATKKNASTLRTALKGSGLRFSTAKYNALTEQQRRKRVPLRLDLKVPVSFKFLLIRSWTMTVQARCDIIVDNLTRNTSIVSSECNTKNIMPWR